MIPFNPLLEPGRREFVDLPITQGSGCQRQELSRLRAAVRGYALRFDIIERSPQSRHKETPALLLDSGVNVNARGREGETPLDLARV